jgi:hypothetical protein
MLDFTLKLGLASLLLLNATQYTSTAQSIIFNENMGNINVGSNTDVNSYNNYQNSSVGVVYSGNSTTVRTSTPSDNTGASGGNNIFIPTTTGANFIIDNINISGQSNVVVSFNLQKSTLAENGSTLSITANVDGGANINMPFNALSTASGSANWTTITTNTTLPIGSTLKLTFTKTSNGGAQFRLDDIKLTTTAPLSITFTTALHATMKGNSSLLSFSATTDDYLTHFIVERSTNGKQFADYDVISPQYNIEGNNYTYTDSAPINGQNYYRIKALTKENSSTYSNTATAYNSAGFSIGLQQNPVEAQLLFNKPISEATNYIIANLTGKVLQQGILALV